MLRKILHIFSRKKDTRPIEMDHEGCYCCPNALEDGEECTCKVLQTLKMEDGTVYEWHEAVECEDWDCSFCH